ncbi:MAG TPA: hypothetical protein P5150_00220 [Candidatus Ratteibacteria bacterium]|nr:hypothetical protein [bacterium]HRR95147.1 hypothetical protein [Candidatus Ratteibacteria bacterium]
MKKAIQDLLTPYKLGIPILEPTGKEGDFDKDMVDCPFIFWYEHKFYMCYIGFDGQGYRSGLASSDELINWKRERMILDWGEKGRFDSYGAAALSILLENNQLGELPIPMKWQGKYWATYTGYPEKGYEKGPGSVGIVYSDNLINWEKADFNPVMVPSDGMKWEQGGIFRTFLMKEKGIFYLFYNAKPAFSGDWIEEIGFATSKDLKTWVRYSNNPVINRNNANNWDLVVGDPYLVKYKDKWVMFYCGVDKKNARDGIAFSVDLKQWEKVPEPILDIGTDEDIDGKHAHKPCVILYKGILYHFYCAVDKNDYRTITVATSQHLGK